MDQRKTPLDAASRSIPAGEDAEQELAEARAERDFARREADGIRATNSYRAIERASAAEALARQQAEEIGKLREAIRKAASDLKTAEYGEGYEFNLPSIARDLDTSLSKEEQPCKS